MANKSAFYFLSINISMETGEVIHHHSFISHQNISNNARSDRRMKVLSWSPLQMIKDQFMWKRCHLFNQCSSRSTFFRPESYLSSSRPAAIDQFSVNIAIQHTSCMQPATTNHNTHFCVVIQQMMCANTQALTLI